MNIVETTELAPGYRIPRIIRGGWQLAGDHGAVDRERAVAEIAAFVDAGLNTVDGADIYTGVEAIYGDFNARRRAAGRWHRCRCTPSACPTTTTWRAWMRPTSAASSNARCSACRWSGSTWCSSTGGTTACPAWWTLHWRWPRCSAKA